MNETEYNLRVNVDCGVQTVEFQKRKMWSSKIIQFV